MTNKQLAEQICMIGDSLFDKTYDPNDKLLLDEASDRLESQSKWISVEDRLPDLEPSLIKYGSMGYKQKSIRVLCACKQKSGKVMVKEGYCEVWVGNPTNPYWRVPGSIDSVTHWMPLPSPPTEKEN